MGIQTPNMLSVSRAVVNGVIYDVIPLDQYDPSISGTNSAVLTDYNDGKVVLPIRNNYNGNNTVPGIYPDGDLMFYVYPNNDNIENYRPLKMIEMSNKDSIKEILEKEETISHLAEPWITSPDNITTLKISDNDKQFLVDITQNLEENDLKDSLNKLGEMILKK